LNDTTTTTVQVLLSTQGRTELQETITLPSPLTTILTPSSGQRQSTLERQSSLARSRTWDQGNPAAARLDSCTRR
jgi:hypothetical protein